MTDQSLAKMVQNTTFQPVEHAGLRYLWHSGAFLTRAEAGYAIEQLWRLCAGSADWEARPVLEISAIDRGSVDAMHALEPGRLPWLRLEGVLPPGSRLPLDTDCLPALCCVSTSEECRFHGEGAFPLDLVAATFLMLTRWEEIHHPGPLDRHLRARAVDSLAYRQGFLDRPVVDEWALVLREWLRHSVSSWQPKLRPFKVLMSYDLDRPRRYPTVWRVVRACVGELLTRTHNPVTAARVLAQGTRALRDIDTDPNVISTRQQMEVCEAMGVQGVFYVMTARRSRYDEGYDLSVSPYRELLEEIRERGHEIGWHPGYRAAEDPEIFAQEKDRMDKLLGTNRYGGRYHYLRWSAKKSWDQWEDHALSHDSSVGYADNVGFRCGTSHSFPCFSIPRQRQLSLIEQPLVIMDCGLASVVGPQCSASTTAEKTLIRAKVVSGQPVVLFHNSQVSTNVHTTLLAAVKKVL